MKVTELTKTNFEQETSVSETVLIDFWASWCGPCKMLSPTVDEVAEENAELKVCKVNIDDEQELAMKFGIMSIPTLVVLKNGKETNRSVGVISKADILKLL
ncbi:MAG: thioredoxin [Clostridia bacterium]|nr:thioredoxin [Clostridia bacterium]